jgi:hypothetical protein
MNQRLWPSLIIVAGVLANGSVDAADCVGLAKLEDTGGLVANVLSIFRSQDSDLAACGSLGSVVAKATKQKKIGGRQLEKDRPLNPAEAQANLDAAQKNPAVRARLERVAKEVQDEQVRTVYEAAILDEEGFYAARDLKIQRLQQALK